MLYLIMLGTYEMSAIYIHRKERHKMKLTVRDYLRRRTQFEYQFIYIKQVVD